MRLLLFNLATDADDPTLGFTTAWIRALAKRVEMIHVVTMRTGRLQVPDNVRVDSVGKERGYSEPRRALEFYRILVRLLHARRMDGCFSHMIPLFTVLAAPLLRAYAVPIITWYAHREVTPLLKMAHRLSDQMVSINRSSYPYRHDKLVELGHGIDVQHFCPNGRRSDEPPLILSVGRLSPIKGLATLVEAVRLLKMEGHDLRCAIVGQVLERDRDYAAQLREQVRVGQLEDVVTFPGPVSHHDTVEWYRRCFAHVNCAPSNHSLDKAPLEAMACGRPSLSSILGFRETVGEWAERLIFRHGDPGDLARALLQLLHVSDQERFRMQDDLRRNVVTYHGLERLADRLVSLFPRHAS
jgi:glycosyltransferase involved in cell wall biosynthesis